MLISLYCYTALLAARMKPMLMISIRLMIDRHYLRWGFIGVTAAYRCHEMVITFHANIWIWFHFSRWPHKASHQPTKPPMIADMPAMTWWLYWCLFTCWDNIFEDWERLTCRDAIHEAYSPILLRAIPAICTMPLLRWVTIYWQGRVLDNDDYIIRFIL